MSTQITTAFVQQYRANVINRYQQGDSKLRGKTRVQPVTGKSHFFERLGATAAIKKTTRHGDTPLVNSEHTRRMVVMSDYEWADLVDDEDKIRLLIDPASEYAINGGKAMNRAYDDEIIAAFTADAMTGETGGTLVTFANDWPVTRAAGEGDEDFSAASLTTANILTLKKTLDNQEVPEEGRYIVVPPAGLTQLLAQSTLNPGSTDFNIIHALVKGEVKEWIGFTWVISTRLPNPDATDTFCFAWHMECMAVAAGRDMYVSIDRRPDKSNAAQVLVKQTYGATRVQGEGVVRFRINKTL